MHLYRAQTGYSTGNVRYEAITDYKVKRFNLMKYSRVLNILFQWFRCVHERTFI